MIDLHTHILPGVDDGAPDLEIALAMARYAVENGIKTVCATPHFYELPIWSELKDRVVELQAALHENEIELEIVAGAELLVDLDLLDLAVEAIPTYGDQGKFCLIEFPMHQVPIYTEQVLFSLQTKGITPIIAHPERYAAVIEDPNIVLGWIRQGSLIQMNAGSILGRFGTKIQETAEIMLTHKTVHFVASDAHGFERRRLNLPEAKEVLLDLLGPSETENLVSNNARIMLQGELPLIEQGLEYKKKRRFLFF